MAEFENSENSHCKTFRKLGEKKREKATTFWVTDK